MVKNILIFLILLIILIFGYYLYKYKLIDYQIKTEQTEVIQQKSIDISSKSDATNIKSIGYNICNYKEVGINSCIGKIIETELLKSDGLNQHPIDEFYENVIYMKTDFSYEMPIVTEKSLNCIGEKKIIAQGKLTKYGPCSTKLEDQNTKNSYCNYKLNLIKWECK